MYLIQEVPRGEDFKNYGSTAFKVYDGDGNVYLFASKNLRVIQDRLTITLYLIRDGELAKRINPIDGVSVVYDIRFGGKGERYLLFNPDLEILEIDFAREV